MKRLYTDQPDKGLFFHLEGPLVDTGIYEGTHRVVEVAGHRGKWSNARLIQPGDKVKVTFNTLGTGTVVGYFVQEGFVGLEIKPDQRPDWHITQNGSNHPHYTVFGAEVVAL